VAYGVSDVDDHRLFAGRTLKASSAPRPLHDRTPEGLLPGDLPVPGLPGETLDAFVADHGTIAFVVLRGDTVLAERYFGAFGRESLVQVFSISKSVTSLLVGAAVRDGVLKGLEQPVTDLVPELAPAGFDAVTLGHLLQMTSGLDYAESDNPFGTHPALYYGTDVEPILLGFTLAEPPGTRFRYKSGESQLLGLALSRALAPRTLTEYAQEVLWTPLGLEYDGFWATDHEGGLEKTFCCLSMRARDLARLGAMVRDGGRVGSREVIPWAWLRASQTPDTTDGGVPFYRLGWWLLPQLEGGLMGVGHLGQYLIILPEHDLVVVRLGLQGSEDLRDRYAALAVALGKHLDATVGAHPAPAE
jgi:CubicO group peptidase (beta-lactamase class C family)